MVLFAMTSYTFYCDYKLKLKEFDQNLNIILKKCFIGAYNGQ